MSSITPPPSPHNDPELELRTTGGDTESHHDQMIIRQESDSSQSSSSTNSIDGSSGSNSEEDSIDSFVTLIGSTANLCSATLGAGILALPFAFYQAGIICGILLVLVSAWATFSSIELLAETYDRYNVSTYESAVEKGLGRRFRNVVEISILIFCCGTAVGYVIAVGDIMDRVIPYLTTARKRALMSLVWLGAMLPLSCLRKMKSLEFASSLGIASIGTLLVAAIVHLVQSGSGDDEDDNIGFFDLDEVDDRFGTFAYLHDRYESDKKSTIISVLGPAGGSWMSVLQACPIFFYAFSSQVNVAQIFEELPGRHGNNPRKIRAMSKVTIFGVSLCGMLYASLSLVTLIDFGDRVQPNILSCYNLSGGGQPLLHAAFLGMALAVIIAFPLNIFPARVSLIQMWEEKKHNNQEEDLSSLPPPVADIEDIRRPLLPRNSNVRNVGYDSAGETDRNSSNNEENNPLQPSTAIFLPDNRIETNNAEDDDEGGTEEFLWAQHTILTLLLAGLALGLALIVPNISVVFGLLGGTTSSLLGFVVPGLLGLQLDRNRIGAWVLVVFGSLIGVFTTGATVYSIVYPA